MRQATPEDVERLVDLMAEFYGESDYPLNRKRAADAFSTLLSDERLGRVWIVEADSENVGYIVLTLGYSMEYGGRDAYVDDLFVRRSAGRLCGHRPPAPYFKAGPADARRLKRRPFLPRRL